MRGHLNVKYIYIYIQGDQKVFVHLLSLLYSSGAQRLFITLYIYIYIYIHRLPIFCKN